MDKLRFCRSLDVKVVAHLLAFILLITANLSVTSGLASAASQEKLGIFLPPASGQSSNPGVGIIFDDSKSALGGASSLGDRAINENADGTQSSQTPRYCLSLQDPKCESTTEFGVYAILQPCANADELFCIEQVFANTTQGRIEGKFLKNLPAATPTDFIGESSANLPTGGPPTIWQIPGVKHSSGAETYVVIVSTRGTGSRSNSKTPAKFQFNEYTVAIYPTSTKLGNYQLVTAAGGAGGTSAGCATNNESECAFRESFPVSGAVSDTTDVGPAFGLSIRFPKSPSSWLYGRLSKPNFSLKKSASGVGVSLEVSGEPVMVPVVYGKSTWPLLPENLQRLYSGIFPSAGNNYIEPDKNKWDTTHIAASGDFDALTSWLPIVKDTAVAVTTQWYFKASNFGVLSRCISADLQVDGVVTSNATAFVPGPPTFNKQTQALEFQVGAPHLTPAGNVFRGSYDLVIRADQARCIYGFDQKAPVRATVSIVSENGQEVVAQELVGEKDGWFFLRAENFAFSSPKLRVKLLQIGSPANSGTIAAGGATNSVGEKKPTSAKIYSLKCISKGGKKSSQRGSNPKCPKGYREVSRTVLK